MTRNKEKNTECKILFQALKIQMYILLYLFNYRIIAYDKTRFNFMFKLFCLIYYYLVLLLQNLFLFSYSFFNYITYIFSING